MKKLSIIFMLCLSGCAGIFVDYIEPVNGPLATLRVDMSPVALVGVYADEKCEKLPEGVFFNGYPNAEVNPMGLIDPVGRKIPAKSGLVVSFHTQVIGYPATKNCTVSLSFDPDPGMVYVGISRFDGEKCVADIQRIETIDGTENRVPVPSVKMSKDVCSVLRNF